MTGADDISGMQADGLRLLAGLYGRRGRSPIRDGRTMPAGSVFEARRLGVFHVSSLSTPGGLLNVAPPKPYSRSKNALTAGTYRPCISGSIAGNPRLS